MNDYLSAKECYKLALTENTESYNANFGIGNILFKKNDISDAIIAFIKAQEVAPSQDYRQLALIRICQCKIILGQTDEAINLLKTNLKTEKLLNPHILGNVLGIMCRAAEASDDVITFHRMAKRQLKLAIDTKNNLLKSEAFFSLSKFYERTNQKSNAKRLLELYLEIVETSEINHNPEQQILALLRLGKIEFENGNWETAISIAQKRLILIKNLNNIEMEANAHANLISIYRKMANMEKCKEHINALEGLKNSAAENNTLLEVASIYDIEMGEMFMENKEWEKAKETFEKALIVVQELDKTEKEAELCEKLGIVHYKLERSEEALIYFNQFLMISQQQKNANSMLNAYGHLTQVHLKLQNLEEGFDCAKFLLTLSDILNNSKEKITALLSIGRIFSKKEEHTIAIKILSKARRLAEKMDSKRELALCFGYLGECQLKINQRQKALTNFCKQLNYFPYINDAEDKCETIAHLIEEKILTNDVVWCAKLCRLQEDIAKEGPITLQMKVLRESAAKNAFFGVFG
uniref:Tetratricopeptide repeat protein 29 n=1 Tax=Panagrolaimus superbus TaxID=310955 RepID=A0A914Z4J9_9BILA